MPSNRLSPVWVPNHKKPSLSLYMAFTMLLESPLEDVIVRKERVEKSVAANKFDVHPQMMRRNSLYNNEYFIFKMTFIGFS